MLHHICYPNPKTNIENFQAVSRKVRCEEAAQEKLSAVDRIVLGVSGPHKLWLIIGVASEGQTAHNHGHQSSCC